MYKQDTFESSTQSSDAIELTFLLRHASISNEGNCNFTHHAVKYPRARGISSSI